MTKGKKRPQLDPNKLSESKPKDEHGKFIEQLFNRTSKLIAAIEDDKLPKELVALEVIQSAFSAFEAGKEHADFQAGYPVLAWREDVVSIPRALLRPLVEAWAKYKASPSGTTFGECLNIEGGGQGKQPALSTLKALNKQAKLSNEVMREYLISPIEGSEMSYETAISTVADTYSISDATVKRASEQGRKRLLKGLEQEGVIGGGNTKN